MSFARAALWRAYANRMIPDATIARMEHAQFARLRTAFLMLQTQLLANRAIARHMRVKR